MGWDGARDRLDWSRERDRVDLVAVVAERCGPPPGRAGRDDWWVCPFHEDRNPSFHVLAEERRWYCFGCGKSGDAADFVQRFDHLTFLEAVGRILGNELPSGRRPQPTPRKPKPPEGPVGLDLADALRLVEDSSARLWGDAGLDALAELVEARGLDLETIQRARLGWVEAVQVPRRDKEPFTARGFLIPWFEGERLVKLNIRQPDGRTPKYAAAFTDRPSIYPDPDAILPGLPTIVAEGEFDAILLGQELTGLATVVTLGGAAMPVTDQILDDLTKSPRWFIATDDDDAGNKAAARWIFRRARRVKPPEPFNDWTDAYRGGVDLRAWWASRLGPDAAPRDPWPELAAQRWGPGLIDSAPGIVVARPTSSSQSP